MLFVKAQETPRALKRVSCCELNAKPPATINAPGSNPETALTYITVTIHAPASLGSAEENRQPSALAAATAIAASLAGLAAHREIIMQL